MAERYRNVYCQNKVLIVKLGCTAPSVGSGGEYIMENNREKSPTPSREISFAVLRGMVSGATRAIIDELIKMFKE